jgi:hypothetical protein
MDYLCVGRAAVCKQPALLSGADTRRVACMRVVQFVRFAGCRKEQCAHSSLAEIPDTTREALEQLYEHLKLQEDGDVVMGDVDVSELYPCARERIDSDDAEQGDGSHTASSHAHRPARTRARALR